MKKEYTYKHVWFTTKWFDNNEPIDKFVSGYRIDKSPLNVYKSQGEWWIVQVPTGLSAGKADSFDKAASIAHEILPLTNWNFDTPEEFTKQDNRKVKDYFHLPYNATERCFAIQEFKSAGRDYIPHSKTQFVADAEGYDSAWAMLEYLHNKATVNCICMRDDCNYMGIREPDVEDGYCHDCGHWSMKSVLVIEGII